MSEFKNGDMVMVSDNGPQWAERRFIGMHSDGTYVCESTGPQRTSYWLNCKPIPQKTYRPFKDVFEVPVNAWFRIKGQNVISRIIGTGNGITIYFYTMNNAVDMKDLLDNYEMSLDGKEWTPAGVEE